MFSKFLAIARYRWMVIVLVTLVGLAGGLLVAFASPRIYSSTVTIYVSASNTNNATTAYQGGLLSEQRVRSYVQLLTGGRVAQDVVRQLNLELTPDELSQEINASALPDSVILTATVSDESPDQAATIANTVGSVFVRLVAELEQPQDRTQPPSVVARIVQPADVAKDPVSPQPLVDIVTGALLGLILGIGLALLLDAIDRTVKLRTQLEATTGAATLTTVPFVKSDGSGGPTSSMALTEGPESESFRRLRTNLQFIPFGDGEGHVIAVSSSVAGEGKTTTVASLGVVLAQAGRRVLVIDADLRKPSLADRFSVDNSVGLTNVLAARVSVRDAIAVSKFSGVRVLPSGPIPPNPSELLGTERMLELLTQARHQFDYILIDTPPLVPVVDAAVVADRADGVILVVRYSSTRTDQIRSAVDALRSASARVLGSVFSMVPSSARGGYGYGYGYGASADGQEGVLIERSHDDQDAVTAESPRGAGSHRPSPAPRP